MTTADVANNLPSKDSDQALLRFVSSWCIHPLSLATIRALNALYIFTSIIVKFATDTSAVGRDFSYFTALTFWGLGFYFAFAAGHGFNYTWIARRVAQGKLNGTTRSEFWLARWPRWLQGLHSVLYSTIIVFPFLVTIVYWSILFRRFLSPRDTWLNTTQHALNTVFAIFEVVIPRTSSPPWLHLVWLLLLLALYMALAFITYATQGFFVYGFLNYKTNSGGLVAGVVIGIAIGATIVFCVVKGLVVLRLWVTETKGGRRGKLYHLGMQETGTSPDDVLMEERMLVKGAV